MSDAIGRGGGGGGGARGGPLGSDSVVPLLLAIPAGLGTAFATGADFTAVAILAGLETTGAAICPVGNDRGTGLSAGVAVGLGFYANTTMIKRRQATFISLTASDGPPFFSSLPWVIGLTTPAFRLAGGRVTLFEGSPEGT